MSTETTTLEAIRTTLAEEMRADERVVVLGEDVAEGGSCATAGLADEFGVERVLTPISEAAIARDRAGAIRHAPRRGDHVRRLRHARARSARQPGREGAPAASSRRSFSARRAARASAAGAALQSLEGWLTHVPGLKVVMPSTAADAAGLLRSAIADPNPVVYVENKTLYFSREDIAGGPAEVPLGRARVARPGRDVTVVALSRLVPEALAAAASSPPRASRSR